MSTFAYAPLSPAHTRVLRAFLHVAATGQPLDGGQPRRAAAAVQAALDAQEPYFAIDPARAKAAEQAESAFSRAVGAILTADATAAIIGQAAVA
jgi:hypothetical protein